ncbi:hypothetical protein IX336_001607 [Porphyromonas levii]|uniref:hypothetical protein n=1 Tax=Porphyromonas levii TaxID=28114 RepID=UPI001BA66D17|nr:hypothetical protein [Porphyromonas levii]MBR8766224.1 hypothetical protein [Porphyromonas levii]
MMTKNITNHIAKGALLCMLLCGLFITSCTPDNSRYEEPEVLSTVKEGERFTARIAINSDELQSNHLRASIESISEVSSLRVLVFDENHNFLYSEDVSKLGKTIPATSKVDDDFLPDSKKDNITEIRYFEVSLIKSSQTRYVHFVANHDWTGFTQDYFAKGTSAGEFMTHESLVDRIEELEETDPKKPMRLALWSMYEATRKVKDGVEVGGLNENTFNGKVIKLLRTYAKVTLNVAPEVSDPNSSERFVLTGFALCNVPDKGTIAPFQTSLYTFDFPFHPEQATFPVGMNLAHTEDNPAGLKFIDVDSIDVNSKSGETPPYYLFEKDNTKAKDKTFVIIKGKRFNSKTGLNGEERFYKIDLVTRKQIDPNSGNTNQTINTYFPFLRNKHYVVNINGIKSDGYMKIDEAIKSAAGNNVFADTKLQDFGNVSDGDFRLSVDPVQMVIVKPGTYFFGVHYSGGNEHVKYYPSWDTKQDLSNPTTPYNEAGYYYTDGLDTYLGGLRVVMGEDGKPIGFEVDVKDIPTDATVEYKVEIAALRTRDGSAVVDGYTGATSPLSRNVRLVLNAPYPFHGELKPATPGNEKEFNLSFRVYEEQIFPKTVFPFDVYIEAPGMTPYNLGGKTNVTIENIYDKNRGKYVTYYKYTVQEEDRGIVSIPFRVNDPNVGTGDVRLTSDFYQPALIQNKKLKIYRNLLELERNEPRGSYAYKQPLEDEAKVIFTFGGQDLTIDDLQQTYGVAFIPNTSTYWSGDFYLDVPEELITKYGNEDITIKTSLPKSPTVGSVRYDFEKTMKVSELTKNKVLKGGSTQPTALPITLELTQVKIIGQVYYYSGSKYSGVTVTKDEITDPTYTFTATRYPYPDIDLTKEFKIEDNASFDNVGYTYHSFELIVKDPEKLKAFTERGTYELKYPNLISYSNSDTRYSLTAFEGNPKFEIVVE